MFEIIPQETLIIKKLPASLYYELEFYGRTCYQSHNNSSNPELFVRKLMKNQHLGVLEHFFVTVKFTTNRAIANELTRHRMASFLQESTRYVNYKNKPFRVIRPKKVTLAWGESIRTSLRTYLELLEKGQTPQEARGVLPLDLATELIMTCNLRELLHIIRMRCSTYAHPQVRELIQPLRSYIEQKFDLLLDLGVADE